MTLRILGLLALLTATPSHASFDEEAKQRLHWKNEAIPGRISDAGLVFSVGATLIDAYDGNWKNLVPVLAAYGATYGTTHLIKSNVERPRPSRRDFLSHPSGHVSMTSMGIPINCRKETWLCGATIGATGVVALGRIGTNAHYATDTLAGLFLGVFFGTYVEPWAEKGWEWLQKQLEKL